MAGIAIPDNVRPALTAIARYHFWILAALVPVVLVPLLFVGTASLRARISAQRKQIEAKLSQAQAVTRLQPHPNEEWRTAVVSDTQAVERETLDEWRRFWHSQRGLRIWPAELGPPFLEDVASLEPGGSLERTSLVRYQNMAPRLARSLPARMGVEDAMISDNRDGIPADGRRPGASALAPKLSWKPESQRRLYESFVWPQPPKTAQVLLAQEELWVYGLFCDLIGGFVKSAGATGAHDSPLTLVDELVVGFPAGVPQGRDSRTEARVYTPKVAADAAGPSPPSMRMDAPPGADGGAQTPWHPRFSGGSGRGMLGPGGADQAAGIKEDDYRGWIYVDFAGKPLSTAELVADDRKAMRMVHLMPFVLRVVVDQRHLDRLLTTLAASPIPIDVRQVRVNPGVGVDAAGPAGPGADGGGPPDDRQTGRRPNDLLVELRGSVALATPPVEPAAAPEESR